MSFHCFVINLASDEGRRTEISEQLDYLGLPYTIFNAVYGDTLSNKELTESYNKNRAINESHDLTLGEIGCALSHIGVYREMIKRNIQHCLVLEDDARLSDDIVEILPKLAERYSYDKPQVVMLNYVEKYQRRGMIRLDDKHYIASTYGGCKNAHGYFLTLSAANNLSENLFPVWLVADRWERFHEKKIIQLKCILPYCIGLSKYARLSNLDSDRITRMKQFQRGGLTHWIHRYLYKKFIYQLFVRPFKCVAKQKETW